jgi:phage terminase large subunit
MDITFKPEPKQHLAWTYLNDKTTTQILYGGSAYCGKSYLGCMWIFLSCIQYPGARYLIGRSRLNVLLRSTLNTFIQICKNFNFTAYKINYGSNIIKFNNGSEVILLDMYSYPNDPNYDRLGSLEITGAFLDELSEISEIGFKVLGSRIRYELDKFNLTPKLFCASNPYNGWSKNHFYIPYKENRLPEYVKFIPAFAQESSFSKTEGGQAYLNNLYNTLDHSLRQRLLYGNWDFEGDEYNLFYYEKLQQCFYNEYFVNTDDKTYITADIGDLGNDKTVIGIWKGWNCLKLIKLEKNETTQVVQKINELRQEYKVLISNIIIDATGVGAGVASLLKGCIRYMAASKAIDGQGYRNIKTQLMYKFAEKVNNLEVNLNFGYDDGLVQECLLYKKEFNETTAGLTGKDDIKKALSRSPDTIDCLYLRAYWEFQRKNTIIRVI